MITININREECSMSNMYRPDKRGNLAFDNQNSAFSCSDFDLKNAGFENGIDDLSFEFKVKDGNEENIFRYVGLTRDLNGDPISFIWECGKYKFLIFSKNE